MPSHSRASARAPRVTSTAGAPAPPQPTSAGCERHPNTQVKIFLRHFDGQPDTGRRGMGHARPLHAQARLISSNIIMASLATAWIFYIPMQRGSVLWSSVQLPCLADGFRGSSYDVLNGTEAVGGQRWADRRRHPRLCIKRMNYLVGRTYRSQ